MFKKILKRFRWHLFWLAWLPTLGFVVWRTFLIAHPDIRPTALPQTLVLERQTESFTCGVHAMSTIYRAHGLDPKAEAIRARLGADTKAVFWIGDSTGVFHGEMWTILHQDYFQIQTVYPDRPEAWDRLHQHLSKGYLASILIRRRATGGLHWVVAAEGDEESISVYDSLKPLPQSEGKEFLEHQALTVCLVRPMEEKNTNHSPLIAHFKGITAMVKSFSKALVGPKLAKIETGT